MQIVSESWIGNNTGCRILEDLFSNAARNVPHEYSHRPWSYPGLDHGKAVLTTNAQLDCFVHAYGLMHMYKMWKALEHLPLEGIRNGFDIVDWGCGQAIATLALLAWLARRCLEAGTPRSVTLLDLSHAALNRAKCLVERGLDNREVEIEAVQTDLSATTCSEKGGLHRSPVVVHLLSNIIDVPRICIKPWLKLSQSRRARATSSARAIAPPQRTRRILASLLACAALNCFTGRTLRTARCCAMDTISDGI